MLALNTEVSIGWTQKNVTIMLFTKKQCSTQSNNWRILMVKLYFSGLVLVALYFFCLPHALSAAEKNTDLSKGQMLYVPAYSHIYSGNREQPFLLTVTLSIRNIDPKHTIEITAVDYYETQGQLLKNYIEAPIQLKPLESLRYVIPERDKSGGSGANFIVEWKSENSVNPPIVESIMISTKSTQGISFTSRGREVYPSDK